MYKYEHQKDISTPAVAQMLSTMLYYKRFFPYYISNVLAGLDEEGKGCVYSYDPIGHMERANFRAGGSAGALLQPLLDNQVFFLFLTIIECLLHPTIVKNICNVQYLKKKEKIWINR